MINLPVLSNKSATQGSQELTIYFERERLVPSQRVIEHKIPVAVAVYEMPIRAGSVLVKLTAATAAEVRPKAGTLGQWLTAYNGSATVSLTFANNPILRVAGGACVLAPFDSITIFWSGETWVESTRSGPIGGP